MADYSAWKKALMGAVVVLVTGTAVHSGTLIGSKHDLTSLNRRAGVEAMGGLAFNDYGDPCIYCHVPDSVDESELGMGLRVTDWNRLIGTQDYELYESSTQTIKPEGLGPESLVCLSCHDGTMSVDTVVNKPLEWTISDEAPMHMRMDEGGGLDKCTQCHDGRTAHRLDMAIIGRDLTNDHPVGVRYPTSAANSDFMRPFGGDQFSNGIRLFEGKVECATCHNVHDPDITPFLRVEPSKLCLTCHNK